METFPEKNNFPLPLIMNPCCKQKFQTYTVSGSGGLFLCYGIVGIAGVLLMIQITFFFECEMMSRGLFKEFSSRGRYTIPRRPLSFSEKWSSTRHILLTEIYLKMEPFRERIHPFHHILGR